MLRVISNLGKNVKTNLNSKNILRIHFSSEQKVTQEGQSEKTFDQKAAFFERFSDTYYDLDKLSENLELKKKIEAGNFSQAVIQEELIKGIKEVYGKNYEKILNKRFTLEIQGHKDGVALGEYELFPKNLQDYGQFNNYTKNGDLIEELQQTTYISIDRKETHKYVVNQNSHFSLLLDEYIPDEYVSELNDNQVCLFGFPKTCDEADINNLLKNEFQANHSSVVIGECVLSLPAYAVLTFANPQEAAAFKSKVNSLKYLMDGKHIYATTFEDSRREHSTNRSLLVSGIGDKEGFNDLLNYLGTFGSIMHFEIVEEPVHSKLPSTEEVLAYLKNHVKEGDESIIYEITDISDGAQTITEYPPYNPNIEVMRDGKKVSEIADEIEAEKERQQLLAKRQLIPRMVLYTWDSNTVLPEEYRMVNATPEQKKIFENIEKKLRTEYTNKQYLFITYSCTQQAQLANHFLSTSGVYESTLKKSTEHYHCDVSHQTSVFKQIKQIKGDVKIKLNDQRISQIEQDNILAQTHEEMREQLLEQANSTQFSNELSKLLENEIIGKTKHGYEHQLHLKSDKLGREFNSKITKNDLNQISTQFQEKQKKNIENMEGLRKDEEEMLNLYRAKVIHADINKVTHPYVKTDAKTENKVIDSLQDMALCDYKIRQQEYLKEEAIRAKWMEDAKEILEKKVAFSRTGKRKPRGSDKGDDVPDIKEPKEEEPDQYYAPQNDYIRKKKFNKYQRYVDEMQRLYDGEYSEAMKDRIFKNGDQACTDIDGNIFVTEAQGQLFDRQILSDEDYETLKYYTTISDVLPNRRITELYKMVKESPDETRFMVNQTKLPTKIFDRSKIPELDENAIPLNNEEFANELNKYVAGLGEHYAVQKDARGDEKIIMFENTPHPVPLIALNVDEIQLLRDCLTTYGFDAEATEREIQYFIKNGDYSEEVLKIVGNEQTIDEDSELDALINATGLSKAELESILKLDLEKDGALVAKSLQEQREEVAFDIKMGTVQTKDLIKTKNTKLRNKDKQGKYKPSTFKFF